MSETNPDRAHLITGGFPPGSLAGHDHDYARLRLLGLLAQRDIPASVANDFADVEKWLPSSRLLISYVAGPYPDAGQCRALQGWLKAGGHWLGLHGTSGGRAERVESTRQRRTVKTEHHAILGCRFLTHPPIQKIKVEVSDADHPLARGLGPSFKVEDEPYFIELHRPGSTTVLNDRRLWPRRHIARDRDPLPHGHLAASRRANTRVLGYTREVSAGAVTYVALGHCHNPAIRAARPADPADPTPATFRRPWETEAFITLLRNAIGWRVGA